MSGKLMGQVYDFHISRSHRDVLLALADHAYDDGTHIFPSMEKLAWKLDISKRQVQRIMAELRENGALIVVREATRYEPTHYRMDLSVFDPKMPLDVGDAINAGMRAGITNPVEALAAAGVSDPSPLGSRGDISRTAGMTSSAARGDIQMSSEPSEQPLEQPLDQDSKRTCAKVPLPEGFPDELRPHLKSAYRVLRDLAARHDAKDVKPVSLASVVMARPRKPLVKAAHDFAAWADGRARRQKDVVASYRNWLDREDDRASVERLDENGLPAATAMNGHVNGNGRGTRLRDRLYRGLAWDELTPHAQASAKDAAAQHLEVWDGGKDSWEGAEERRAADAAVRAEKRRNGQVPAGAWNLAGDDD